MGAWGRRAGYASQGRQEQGACSLPSNPCWHAAPAGLDHGHLRYTPRWGRTFLGHGADEPAQALLGIPGAVHREDEGAPRGRGVAPGRRGGLARPHDMTHSST